MGRWICTLLVVLVALGASGGHEPGFAATVAPGQAAAPHCPEGGAAETATDRHDARAAAETGDDGRMTFPCEVVCLGGPAPRGAASHAGRSALPRGAGWRIAAEHWQGRGVGPGERPPRSV
ncbi:hypothetical protein SAMN05421538_11088 [Paracoccus isoporae]|uniref:Secreted protein n=1 Tax=Paracoccus isoporae TaxID=591205 RepID=A0A1G7FCK7_9RHOB|nr:hypothetical protein [Paracoccus isoporae]SDE73622.1 hypothetical protein SAMN05421538_11088 [Paracoccus isoporae]